jgi:hypothetical protein
MYAIGDILFPYPEPEKPCVASDASTRRNIHHESSDNHHRQRHGVHAMHITIES